MCSYCTLIIYICKYLWYIFLVFISFLECLLCVCDLLHIIFVLDLPAYTLPRKVNCSRKGVFLWFNFCAVGSCTVRTDFPCINNNRERFESIFHLCNGLSSVLKFFWRHGFQCWCILFLLFFKNMYLSKYIVNAWIIHLCDPWFHLSKYRYMESMENELLEIFFSICWPYKCDLIHCCDTSINLNKVWFFESIKNIFHACICKKYTAWHGLNGVVCVDYSFHTVFWLDDDLEKSLDLAIHVANRRRISKLFSSRARIFPVFVGSVQYKMNFLHSSVFVSANSG